MRKHKIRFKHLQQLQGCQDNSKHFWNTSNDVSLSQAPLLRYSKLWRACTDTETNSSFSQMKWTNYWLFIGRKLLRKTTKL